MPKKSLRQDRVDGREGLRITFGSDSHKVYNDDRFGGVRGDLAIGKYLSAAGFKDGDFYTLRDEDLW